MCTHFTLSHCGLSTWIKVLIDWLILNTNTSCPHLTVRHISHWIYTKLGIESSEGWGAMREADDNKNALLLRWHREIGQICRKKLRWSVSKSYLKTRCSSNDAFDFSSTTTASASFCFLSHWKPYFKGALFAGIFTAVPINGSLAFCLYTNMQ